MMTGQHNAGMRPTAKKRVLQPDVNASLSELVSITRKLIGFADQETQCLITHDHIGFAFTQRDKENLAARYMKASEEFRNHVEDFKTADRGLLMQLDRLQKDLKEKTSNNNVLIEQIKTKASSNTQSTLFTAQELGQRVRFQKPITAKDSA